MTEETGKQLLECLQDPANTQRMRQALTENPVLRAFVKHLDPFSSSLPVLETHLNAQVRNILQYMETTRGSKAMTIQLARQGLDGAEYEFARLLYEDRNGEAQSYVDWLVHVHRQIQMEVCYTIDSK